MTSGRSCINWMREAGRGHLAAILSWGSYGMLLCGVLLGLQLDLMGVFFGIGNNKPLFLLCTGLGMCIGFLEFGYLLQARKQEFYFSLPVKKSTIFYSRYFHGLFYGLLPMVCYMFLCGIYQSSIDSLFMGYSVGYTFCSLLVYGMVFLLFYHVTIFAVCVCGQLAAAFCILGLVSYGIHFFLERVCLVFMKQLYETFYRSPVLEMLEKTLVPWQLGQSLTGQEMYEKFQILETKPESMQLAAGLIWIAVFGALSVLAHKHRKTENVGCVFTVKAAERITEVVLAVLAGTGVCGLLLSVTGIGEMSRLPAALLLSAAGVMAAVVIHFIYVRLVHDFVRILKKSDTKELSVAVRSFAGRNLWLVSECVVIAAVVCVLSGNASRYDAYLPDNDDVECIGLALAGVDMDPEDYNDMKNLPEDYLTSYLLGRYELSEDGKDAGMDWISRLRAENESMRYDVMSADVTTERKADAGAGNGDTKVTVCFRKTDGSEVYRTYPVSETMLLDFSDVYETEEYKQAAYPLIAQGEETVEGTRFVWNDGVSEQTLKLTEEEKKEFFKSYKSDIEVLKMMDLQTALPMGGLSVESEIYNRSTSVMIYPFLKKCTAFLKEHGVDLEKQVTDYPVQSVTVWKLRPMVPGKTGGMTMQRYETEEEIAGWRDRLIPKKFCIQPLLYPVDLSEEIEAEVTEPESGAVISVECARRQQFSVQ